jgi:hypothetical protein
MKFIDILAKHGFGVVLIPAEYKQLGDDYPFMVMHNEGLQFRIVYAPCGMLRGLSVKNRSALIEPWDVIEYKVINRGNMAELYCMMADVSRDVWGE